MNHFLRCGVLLDLAVVSPGLLPGCDSSMSDLGDWPGHCMQSEGSAGLPWMQIVTRKESLVVSGCLYTPPILLLVQALFL